MIEKGKPADNVVDHVPHVDTEPQVDTSKVSLETVLKLTAVGSAFLYAVLFVGYRRYYSLLGVTPEDVGVTSTFVLVRSMGFIALMACLAAIIVSITLANHFAYRRYGNRAVGAIIGFSACFVLAVPSALYTTALFPDLPNLPLFLLSMLVSTTGIVSGVLLASARRIAITLLAVMGTMLILLLPAVATTLRAGTYAQAVLVGRTVAPFEILSIPVLDVSADLVRVAWIGGKEQRPAIFRNSDEPITGILIGQTSNLAILRVAVGDDFHTFRLPASAILIEKE